MFSEYLLAKARKIFYKVEIGERHCYIYHTGDYFLRGKFYIAWNNTMLLRYIRRYEPEQKYRDCFGRLTFRLGKYEVENAGCAPYRIVKRYPNYRTNAVFNNPYWDETPAFDSWIHAVKFLKEHKGELL